MLGLYVCSAAFNFIQGWIMTGVTQKICYRMRKEISGKINRMPMKYFESLLSLINDVLDMSRIESGKVKIEEKAVHLPDLVHDVRSIIQPDVSAKRLSLFIDTMDVENEDIITDPMRLNQIFAMTNLYRLEDIDIPRQQITFHALIDNFNNTAEALCYDKHFSITTSGDNITLFINLNTVMQIYENLLSNSIRYAKSDIAISAVIENNNLVISVSDDGCGFKNIDIEKATLPFYKSSKDISTEHLGLGLNISKILSERHGGNIQIANNEAGGACVTLKINCNES